MFDKPITLGVSYEPNVVLEQEPVGGAVPAGTYVACNAYVIVDVVEQDPKTGMVTIEFLKLDSEEKMYDTISSELFNQLFYRPPALTLGKQA